MLVPHSQIAQAWKVWCVTQMDITKDAPDFYDFLSLVYRGDMMWEMSDAKAHLLTMLLSPHWKTLYKAWCLKHE